MDVAVDVQDVSMRFNLAKEKIESMKEYFIKMVKKELHFEEFYALKNISFTIEKGESLGVVGNNGSGKSTLLKVVSRIYKPTTGTVAVNGVIAPMIELGAGFDAELTARENIFLNGAVLGFNNRFILERYDEIIDFAELKEFEDVPLKNFSSGMRARLGFAISTIIKPEILIVDEVLSVGDFKFKKKSKKKMDELLSGGTTLILVSHSFEDLEKLCKRAIWLSNGEIMLDGDINTVCNAYQNS